MEVTETPAFAPRSPQVKRKGLKPTTGLKRGSGLSRGKKTVSSKKKKRHTEADLKREWLIPKQSHHLRYVGLRGVYWYWLSRDVRKAEWEKWNGECITCLIPLATWEEGQCGHMVSSAECGEYLRFNRKNLALQHSHCNNPRFNPNAGARNAVHYDMRYGQGEWDKLYALRKVEWKCPKQEEYRELIRALPSYQEAVENLSRED